MTLGRPYQTAEFWSLLKKREGKIKNKPQRIGFSGLFKKNSAPPLLFAAAAFITMHSRNCLILMNVKQLARTRKVDTVHDCTRRRCYMFALATRTKKSKYKSYLSIPAGVA